MEKPTRASAKAKLRGTEKLKLSQTAPMQTIANPNASQTTIEECKSVDIADKPSVCLAAGEGPDGCQNEAEFICRAVKCRKDYGCGKPVCEEHLFQECFLQNFFDPNSTPCEECGPRVQSTDFIYCGSIIIALFLILLVCFILYSYRQHTISS